MSCPPIPYVTTWDQDLPFRVQRDQDGSSYSDVSTAHSPASRLLRKSVSSAQQTAYPHALLLVVQTEPMYWRLECGDTGVDVQQSRGMTFLSPRSAHCKSSAGTLVQLVDVVNNSAQPAPWSLYHYLRAAEICTTTMKDSISHLYNSVDERTAVKREQMLQSIFSEAFTILKQLIYWINVSRRSLHWCVQASVTFLEARLTLKRYWQSTLTTLFLPWCSSLEIQEHSP